MPPPIAAIERRVKRCGRQILSFRLDGDDRYQQDRRDERDRHSRGRARPLRAHAGPPVCDEV